MVLLLLMVVVLVMMMERKGNCVCYAHAANYDGYIRDRW